MISRFYNKGVFRGDSLLNSIWFNSSSLKLNKLQNYWDWETILPSHTFK
jgi:hypothetical protein